MRLESVIDIDAPQPRVWSVTIDVERWPEWAPTFTSVERIDEGAFVCGSAALIRQPGLPAAKWVVTDLTPGERFTWETRVLGMHMLATHELTSGATATRNTLVVEFRGVVARLLWPLIRASVQRSLERENAGLKARCEEHRDR